MSQHANRHSIEWERQLLLKKEAAEDLYEALVDTLAELSCATWSDDESPNEVTQTILKAKAALAKAEGRS